MRKGSALVFGTRTCSGRHTLPAFLSAGVPAPPQCGTHSRSEHSRRQSMDGSGCMPQCPSVHEPVALQRCHADHAMIMPVHLLTSALARCKEVVVHGRHHCRQRLTSTWCTGLLSGTQSLEQQMGIIPDGCHPRIGSSSPATSAGLEGSVPVAVWLCTWYSRGVATP